MALVPVAPPRAPRAKNGAEPIRGARTQYWCCTISNLEGPPDEDLPEDPQRYIDWRIPPRVCDEELDLWRYQAEVGAGEEDQMDGLLHIQLFCKTRRQGLRYAQLTAMFGLEPYQVHWEPARNFAGSWDYCGKEDTRLIGAETHEHGERPTEKRGRPRQDAVVAAAAKRKMIAERHQKILEMAKKKARRREFLEDPELGPFFLGRGPSALKLLVDVYINVPDPYAFVKPFVVWVYGGTELGKSREIRRWLREICQLPWYEVYIWMPSKEMKWHDKYERHQAMIIDDFRGGCTMTKLRNVFDGYEIPFEEKGGQIVHCPRVIVVSSDIHPEELELKGIDPETGNPIMMTPLEYSQIERRISHIIHFQENELRFPNRIMLGRPEVLDHIHQPPVPADDPLNLLNGPGEEHEGDIGRLRRQLGLPEGEEGWEELQLDQIGSPEPNGIDLL